MRGVPEYDGSSESFTCVFACGNTGTLETFQGEASVPFTCGAQDGIHTCCFVGHAVHADGTIGRWLAQRHREQGRVAVELSEISGSTGR